MPTQRTKTPPLPAAWIDEVLADIAYFRRCIDEAGPKDCAARRAVQAAYTPFLTRRFQLLASLTANTEEESTESENG